MAKKKKTSPAKKKPAKKIKFAPIVLQGKRPQHLKFRIGKHVVGLSLSLSQIS